MADEEAVHVGGESEAVEAFGKWSALNGLGEPPGRVVGALMAHDQPLTEGEAAQCAGVTPEQAKHTFQALARMGLVHLGADGRAAWRPDAWTSRFTVSQTRIREFRTILDGVARRAEGVLGQRITEAKRLCDFLDGEMPGMTDRYKGAQRS